MHKQTIVVNGLGGGHTRTYIVTSQSKAILRNCVHASQKVKAIILIQHYSLQQFILLILVAMLYAYVLAIDNLLIALAELPIVVVDIHGTTILVMGVKQKFLTAVVVTAI